MENQTLDNRTILNRLENRNDADRNVVVDEQRIRKYLVFNVGERPYALDAEAVREISSNNEFYYVPFVPPYVRGYANRHGQPYTIFDLQMLFENVVLDSKTLLILSMENDQAALLISDVLEILKVAESEVHRLTSEDDSSRYFANSLNLKGKEVFVLNVHTLLERLERDLERS